MAIYNYYVNIDGEGNFEPLVSSGTGTSASPFNWTQFINELSGGFDYAQYGDDIYIYVKGSMITSGSIVSANFNFIKLNDKFLYIYIKGWDVSSNGPWKIGYYSETNASLNFIFSGSNYRLLDINDGIIYNATSASKITINTSVQYSKFNNILFYNKPKNDEQITNTLLSFKRYYSGGMAFHNCTFITDTNNVSAGISVIDFLNQLEYNYSSTLYFYYVVFHDNYYKFYNLSASPTHQNRFYFYDYFNSRVTFSNIGQVTETGNDYNIFGADSLNKWNPTSGMNLNYLETFTINYKDQLYFRNFSDENIYIHRYNYNNHDFYGNIIISQGAYNFESVLADENVYVDFNNSAVSGNGTLLYPLNTYQLFDTSSCIIEILNKKYLRFREYTVFNIKGHYNYNLNLFNFISYNNYINLLNYSFVDWDSSIYGPWSISSTNDLYIRRYVNIQNGILICNGTLFLDSYGMSGNWYNTYLKSNEKIYFDSNDLFNGCTLISKYYDYNSYCGYSRFIEYKNCYINIYEPISSTSIGYTFLYISAYSTVFNVSSTDAMFPIQNSRLYDMGNCIYSIEYEPIVTNYFSKNDFIYPNILLLNTPILTNDHTLIGLFGERRKGVGAFYFSGDYGQIGSFYFGPIYENISSDTLTITVSALVPDVTSVIQKSNNIISNTLAILVQPLIPDIFTSNLITVDFVGIPRIGSSPLIVDFKAYVTIGGIYYNKYKVSQYRWYFDVDNYPDVYEVSTSPNITHVYSGYRGQKYSVKLCCDIKLL